MRRNHEMNGHANGVSPTSPRVAEDSPYFVLTQGGQPVELVAHARADGRVNLPDTGAQEPNEVETAICREYERQHLELVEQTRNELRSLTAQFDELEDQLPNRQDLVACVAESVAGIEHDLASDHRVIPLRQELQLRRRDLRAFVRERRLVREASYPTSRLLHFGTIVLLVVVESVANAEFFASVSTLGLVGGFLQAVGVSVVNVVSGALAGYFCIRGLNSMSRHVRALAGFGVLAYALFALGFNLAVARYRDLAASGVTAAFSVFGLLGSPLDLSLPSAALFSIGLIASLLGLWKGFRLDDAVPGFGERHRRFIVANTELERRANDLRHQVLGRVEAVPERSQAVVRRADQVLKEMHGITVRAQRALESYAAQRAHLEDRCEVLLRRYRDENRAVRTRPEPRYFAAFPSFPAVIDDSPVKELLQRVVRADHQLDELSAEEHRIRRGQADRVRDAATRFESCLTDRLREADAGRGDGSEYSIGDDTRFPENRS